MNPEDDLVEVGDKTPPIQEQARLMGWKADIFNFGKAENPDMDFFNPGLVRRPDGLWLLVRTSELVDNMPYGRNKIWACKLSDDHNLTPQGGPLLRWPDSAEPEQFEDPRAVYWNNQTWIGCVNFTWFEDGSWTGAHQVVGIFQDEGLRGQDGEDARWNALARRDPPAGTNLDRAGNTNGKHNKNWLWFFHDGKLHLLYMSDPWHVIEFGSAWDEQIEHKWEGAKWKYGTIRGGTPPVLIGDLYYTFFHSSLPWRGRFRRYYMGALAFEAKPPFKPVQWTQEPMLMGSQNDPWHQGKPLVVFPCGALYDNDWWTISLGINDLKCAWIKIPHEDVVKCLKSAPVMPGIALLAAKTEKPVLEHIPYTERGEQIEKGKKENSSRPQTAPAPVLSEPAPTGNDDRIYRPELLRTPVELRPMPRETPEAFEQRVESTLPPETEETPAAAPAPVPKKKYKKHKKKKH